MSMCIEFLYCLTFIEFKNSIESLESDFFSNLVFMSVSNLVPFVPNPLTCSVVIFLIDN